MSPACVTASRETKADFPGDDPQLVAGTSELRSAEHCRAAAQELEQGGSLSQKPVAMHEKRALLDTMRRLGIGSVRGESDGWARADMLKLLRAYSKAVRSRRDSAVRAAPPCLYGMQPERPPQLKPHRLSDSAKLFVEI
jgi:hypothetical protein